MRSEVRSWQQLKGKVPVSEPHLLPTSVPPCLFFVRARVHSGSELLAENQGSGSKQNVLWHTSTNYLRSLAAGTCKRDPP